MKEPVRILRDQDTIKLILERNRYKILSLLKSEDMTISQIAEAMNKDRTSIYRHLKKLEKVGMIEQKGERILNYVPERIYGRTAEIILPFPKAVEPYSILNKKLIWNENITSKLLHCLDEMGYDNECSKEMVDELNEFLKDVDDTILKSLKERKEEVGGIDFFELLGLRGIVMLIELLHNSHLDKKLKKILSNFEYPSE
ncbi:MAG: ArsR family transcriptional regulator [Thermoplasmatota archaeon]